MARGLGLAVLPGICLTDADRLVLDAVPLPKELQGNTTYGVVVRRDKRPTELLRGLLALIACRRIGRRLAPREPQDRSEATQVVIVGEGDPHR